MGLTYQAWIRTRTINRDYFWVGDEPKEWWQTWGSSLLRREPCLLRDSNGGQQRIFLNRIVSRRRDSAGTPIRYDIALELGSNETGLGEAQVAELVSLWWDQHRLGYGDAWPLADLLDDAFSGAAQITGLTTDLYLESAERERSLNLFPIEARSETARPPIPEPSREWQAVTSDDARELLVFCRKAAFFKAATREIIEEVELPPEVVLIVDDGGCLQAAATRSDPTPAKKALPPSSPMSGGGRSRSSVAGSARLQRLLIASLGIVLAATFVLLVMW